MFQHNKQCNGPRSTWRNDTCIRIRTQISNLIHECRCTLNELQYCICIFFFLTCRISSSHLWVPGEQPLVSVQAYLHRCNRTQWVSLAGSVLEYRPTACGGSFSFLLRSFLSSSLAREITVPSPIFYHHFTRSACALRHAFLEYSAMYSKVDTRVNVHGNPASVVRPRFVVHARWSTVYNEEQAPRSEI